jgi:chromosome segregation ATPase
MEAVVKRKSTRFAGIAFIGLLLTTTISIPLASATTVKSGASCSKLGAKTKANGSVYTCGTNPTTTSKKLVWIISDCVTANAQYLDSVKQMLSIQAQVANVQAQLTTSLKSSTDLLPLLQSSAATAETADYVISSTTNATGSIIQQMVTGRLAAIDQLNAHIADSQAKLVAAQADVGSTTTSNPDLLVKKTNAVNKLAAVNIFKTQAAIDLGSATGQLKISIATRDAAVLAKKSQTLIDTLTKVVVGWTKVVSKRTQTLTSLNSASSSWQNAINSITREISDFKSAGSQNQFAVRSYQQSIKASQDILNRMIKIPINLAKKIAATQAQIKSLTTKLADSSKTKASLLASVKSTADQAKSLRALSCKPGL